jgi:hypothetical protein
MVDEVISGGQQIASEATLQRLVDIMSGGSGGDGGGAAKLKDLADKAGVAGKTFGETGSKMGALIPGLTNFGQGLINGSASASQLAGVFTVLGGNIGLAAAIISKLIAIQEENFAAYQKISSAGANFGGSLTDLRLAAMKSYLTLEQFGSLVKNNTNNLITLGGSVNSGAKAFAQYSNSILSSNLGNQLFSLGYTAEGANDAMLTYLGSMGVNNAEQLKNDKTLRAGTANYLEELDRLAQVTGKSREELNEKMKKDKLDADIRMTAARMPQKERDAFMSNVRYMTTMYGDAGKDMALAQAQGRGVITKEGQLLSAIAPKAQAAYAEMDSAAKRYGVGSKEYIAAQNKVSLAMQDGLGKVPTTVLTANDAFKGLSTAVGTTADQQMAGLTSREAFDKRDKEIADETAKRKQSEASDMSTVMTSLKELGTTVMQGLTPALRFLTPILGGLFSAISFLLKPIFWLGELAMSITEGVLKPFKVAFNDVTESFKSAMAKLAVMFEPVIAPFKRLFDTGSGNMGKFFSLLGDVVGFLIGAPFRILFGTIEIAASLLTGVFQTLGTVIDAVLYPFQALGDAMSSLFDFLTEAVKKVSGFLSPSTWFSGSSSEPRKKMADGGLVNSEPRKKMADGGLVNRPTSILAGEAGPEAIIPLAKFENIIQNFLKPNKIDQFDTSSTAGKPVSTGASTEVLKAGIDQLNKNVLEMIRSVKDVAENTKRTFEATRSLNGNHFG